MHNLNALDEHITDQVTKMSVTSKDQKIRKSGPNNSGGNLHAALRSYGGRPTGRPTGTTGIQRGLG